MKYLPYLLLFVSFWNGLPQWYNLLKTIYQDIKQIYQTHQRHYYRRHRRRWWQVLLWKWK